MLRFIFISFLSTIVFTVSGQSLTSTLLIPAADQMTAGSADISWILGETINETFQSSSGSLMESVNSTVLEDNTAPSAVFSNLEDKVTVYPNPAIDKIIITIPIYKDQLYLKLFDLSGRIILTKKIESAEEVISLQQINVGIYFLEINSDSHIRKIFKIIKQ